MSLVYCVLPLHSMSLEMDVGEVLSLTQRLDTATRSGSLTALRDVLPAEALSRIWEAATDLLAAEPTLLEVQTLLVADQPHHRTSIPLWRRALQAACLTSRADLCRSSRQPAQQCPW